MNKFKITPKIALIIVLALITVAGVIIYLSYSSKAKKNPNVADSGFLSFFGGRKVKPNDESNIPGVIPNQGGDTGGLSGGLTSGEATSGDTAGGTAGNTSNGGKLMLRPIGNSNLSLNDNNANGGSGTATGGNTGGNTNAGTATTGNTGGGSGGSTTGGNNIPQIDCTPPTLPYTQPQIEELKSLTQRFYRISANLHTASDIENELDTQKSYFDLYTEAKNYTKQCYAELEQTDPGEKYAGKATNASARNHPYITEKVLEIIGKYDPRVIITRNSDAARIDKEIAVLQDQIAIATTQIYFLKNSGITLNSYQQEKLKALEGYSTNVPEKDANGNDKKDSQGNIIYVRVPGDVDRFNTEIEYKKNQKWAVQNTKLSLMYGDVLGAFFTEEKYKSLVPNYKFTSTNTNELTLKVPRVNVNTRFNKLWGYTKQIIVDRGQNTQVIDNMWTVEHEYYQYNPLKAVAQDRVNDALDTAPRDAAGNRNSWVHRFNMLEEGLRVW